MRHSPLYDVAILHCPSRGVTARRLALAKCRKVCLSIERTPRLRNAIPDHRRRTLAATPTPIHSVMPRMLPVDPVAPQYTDQTHQRRCMLHRSYTPHLATAQRQLLPRILRSGYHNLIDPRPDRSPPGLCIGIGSQRRDPLIGESARLVAMHADDCKRAGLALRVKGAVAGHSSRRM